MKPTITNVLIGISILFSIGGAFNVGMTGFWLAVPFMVLLSVLTFKRSRNAFTASLIFIILCILVNITIYKNPLVFPVLQKNAQIEVIDNSLYRKFSDGSGSFVMPNDVYINEPTKEQKDSLSAFLNDENAMSIEVSDSAIITQNNTQTIYKLKKGQKIEIEKVFNFGGIDSTNENYLVTKFGNMSEGEISKGTIKITPQSPVQASWSKYLGNLMYWPVFPIAITTMFKQ